MTDRHRFAAGAHDDGLVGFARAAGAAGIDLVQVREPDMSGRALTDIVGQCVEATRGTRTRIIVNDRLDVALAAGAHGVHLRGNSFSAARVRDLAPEGFIIGRSVHGTLEAQRSADEGNVDYLVLGTIFSSRSKPAAHRLLGVEPLVEMRGLGVPVLGIGGVTASTIPALAAAGAAGFAAIGYFADAFVAGPQMLVAAAAEARRRFDSSKRLPTY